MFKFFYIILYIINWKYKYIIKDQIKLKNNEYFIFKVDAIGDNPIKITFKVDFMNGDKKIYIHNGIRDNYVDKTDSQICSIWMFNNIDLIQYFKVNKINKDYYINKDNLYNNNLNREVKNIYYNYITFESKNDDIILDSVVVIYYDNINVDYSSTIIDKNDYFDFYPLTYILIDFFNNQPGSKYLFNEIKNLYTWNYIGQDLLYGDFYQLFSNYDKENIPSWYTINNIGSFRVNSLITRAWNNMLIKNFCLGFNIEIFLKPQNNEYTLFTIFNNPGDKNNFLKSKIILRQKNYLTDLKFQINNNQDYYELSYIFNQNDNLIFNVLILNFREFNSKIYLHSKINLFEKFSSVKDFSIKKNKTNIIEMNKFKLNNIIIGNIIKRDQIKLFPIIFKIKFNEFQILKGNINFENKNNLIESMDINDKIVKNFNSDIYKLLRKTKEVIDLNNNSDCYEFYDCYKYYINKNYINNSFIINSEFNNLVELKKSDNVLLEYNYNLVNNTEKIIEIIIEYILYNEYLISIQYENIEGKLFNLKAGTNKQILFHTYVFGENITNFKIIFYPDLKFNHNDEYINIYYKLKSLNSDFLYYNEIDCKKLYSNTYLMDIVIGTNYGICIESKGIYEIPYKYFDSYLRMYSYCYEDCINCELSNVNKIIKCKQLTVNDNYPKLTNYLYNKNYLKFFLITNKNENWHSNFFEIADKCGGDNKKFNLKNFRCENKNLDLYDSGICDWGYYKNGSKCAYCYNNFKLHIHTNNVGYLINFDNCKDCLPNQHFNIFLSDCDSNKIENCEKEKFKNNFIDEVLIKYYDNTINFNDKNTFINLKNNSINVINKLCIKCNDDSYLDIDKCIKCNSKKTNCNKCIEIKNYFNNQIMKEIKCISCSDEYFLNIDNICTLKKNSSNCKNYFLLVVNNCENCLKNCKICNNTSSCNTCGENFIYSISENKCILMEGCWNDQCIKCKNGYFMKDKTCYKCTDNCLLCKNWNECLLCTDYFHIYGSECIRNLGCSNDICTKCINNYTLLIQGICIKCFENCEFCNKANKCLKCNNNYKNNINSCIKFVNKPLTQLNINNFKINGKWVKKKLYYKFDDLTNNFIKCLNKYLEIKINDTILCIKSDYRIKFYNFNGTYGLNPNYFLLHKNNKILIEKIKFINKFNNKCIISKDSLSCNKCIKGYTFDEDKNCKWGVANLCKEYFTINICKTCYKNYYINELNNCKNKINNNNCLRYLDNRCFICKKGYYINGRYCNKCNNVLKNCEECSNSEYCTKCNKNNKKNYLDFKDNNCKLCKYPCQEISNFKIVKCYKGYYWENNNCKLCNLIFCISCFKNRCLKCQSGYYLLDKLCYKCQNNCSKCNKNDCLESKIYYYLDLEKIKKCNNNCLICNSNYYCNKCNNYNNYYLDFITKKCIYKTFDYKFKNNNKLKKISNCKMGFYNKNGSLICERCSINCKECSLYKENCIVCEENYFLLKIIFSNNLLGKCFKTCDKNQIFDLSLKKCLNCGIYEWDIYNKFELRLYYSNNLILNDINVIKNLIHIETIDSITIKFKILKIKKSYILIKLNFKYNKRITYLQLLVKEGIIKNNNKCIEKNYNKIIRGIDFKFVKKSNSFKKIEILNKDSKEFKQINKYGKLFENIAYYTSIILFLVTIIDIRFSNMLSKLFNNFQIISYISIINIQYSKTINTIFEIVNLNLSIVINTSDFINYSNEKQSKFSRKIYSYNPRIKNIDQRFFTNLDLNIILILISFIVKIFFIYFEKFYNHFFTEAITLERNKKKNEKIGAERNINNEKKNNLKPIKLKKFEKIKYVLTIFQLTMIMGESTNMFIFWFNFYKSFNLINFTNIYHYIIIFYLIFYNFSIFYFILTTINIMNKLKKYDIFKIYKKKLNYLAYYFFIVGNFEEKSYHYYLWIIEIFRNFLIAFNLIYMNNNINFQILSLVMLQIIYLIFILFLIKIDSFESKKIKLQEFILLYLLIKILIIHNNKNKLFLDNNYSEITGIIIGLFMFNVLVVIYEIIINIYRFIYNIYNEINFN